MGTLIEVQATGNDKLDHSCSKLLLGKGVCESIVLADCPHHKGATKVAIWNTDADTIRVATYKYPMRSVVCGQHYPINGSRTSLKIHRNVFALSIIIDSSNSNDVYSIQVICHCKVVCIHRHTLISHQVKVFVSFAMNLKTK